MKTPQKANLIYQELRKRLEEQLYPPESALPQENILAEELNVSRKTLRVALSRLELENWIQCCRGKGNFVRERTNYVQKILVVTCNNMSNSTPYPAMLAGIQAEAFRRNIKIDECPVMALESNSDTSSQRILELEYDGIICAEANYLGTEPILDTLRRTGLPVIIPHGAKSDSKTTGFAVMGTNYPRLVRDGLRYLRQTGHFRVAYLGYQQMRLPRTTYLQYVQKIGLCTRPEYVVNLRSCTDVTQIREDISELLQVLQLPTALFCFSDLVAICAYDVLQAKGLRIPDDMAVLSIGGFSGCDFLTPTLSAMDFDAVAIGRMALERLLEMIHNGIKTMPFMATPHHLTERQSTTMIKH